MVEPLDSELFDEFSKRIPVHLKRRGSSELVRDLWRGYLRALLEWRIVSSATFKRLVALVESTSQTQIHFPFVAHVKANSETGAILSPSAEELFEQMTRSIRDHGSSHEINVMWHGYLAALQEWRSFKIKDFDYHRLQRVPKVTIGDEITEIFLGFADEDEQKP